MTKLREVGVSLAEPYKRLRSVLHSMEIDAGSLDEIVAEIENHSGYAVVPAEDKSAIAKLKTLNMTRLVSEAIVLFDRELETE